jgi:hypothetical protein
MGPADGSNESQLNILTVSPGEHILHCNKYERMQIEQMSGLIIDSSVERMKTFKMFKEPKNRGDIVKMLGDQSAVEHTVFRDGPGDMIKTIAVGIFDLVKKTWTLFSDNPKFSSPLVELPLVLKEV